jgi:hypothetical protein
MRHHPDHPTPDDPAFRVQQMLYQAMLVNRTRRAARRARIRATIAALRARVAQLFGRAQP